ncbi:hypothetical protein Tco_0813965, partial [Tanacetum coccineum]
MVVFGLQSLLSNAKQLIKLNGKQQRDIPKGYLAVYMGEVQGERFVLLYVSHHVVDILPDSHTIALPREFPDHTPLLLSNATVDYGPSPFKLYNSWLLHKDFTPTVVECWTTKNLVLSNPANVFKSKLQQLKATLKQWRKNVAEKENLVSMNLRNKIDELDMKAETSFLSSVEVESRITLVKSLADIEYGKVKDLKQKAKTRWALEGDENTSFFHVLDTKKLATQGYFLIAISLYDSLSMRTSKRPFTFLEDATPHLLLLFLSWRTLLSLANLDQLALSGVNTKSLPRSLPIVSLKSSLR